MLKTILRAVRDEDGATAVEYGLIVSLIVLAMFAALNNVSKKTINMWNNVSNTVSGAS
jgi:pilus assembly protein Flp/PilA